MIVRVRGVLESVRGDRAVVWMGARGEAGVARELLVPAAIVDELGALVGQEVELETVEYLESVGQGASFVPRLIGFMSADQRALFELLTKVKGLGNRRALRAFAAPVGEIASAIGAGDTRALTKLPEIGKKLAETICLELRERVVGLGAGSVVGPGGGAIAGAPVSGGASQAVAALVRLGENRASAEALVGEAVRVEPKLAGADEILAAALALKG